MPLLGALGFYFILFKLPINIQTLKYEIRIQCVYESVGRRSESPPAKIPLRWTE